MESGRLAPLLARPAIRPAGRLCAPPPRRMLLPQRAPLHQQRHLLHCVTLATDLMRFCPFYLRPVIPFFCLELPLFSFKLCPP